MKFSENQLKLYAAPISETEEQKCKNAIGMVRDALKNIGFSDGGKDIEKMYTDTYSYSLEMSSTDYNRKVKIFVKGSYANNTNVRTESDVDIAIVLESTFSPVFRKNITGDMYGFSDSKDNLKQFKDDVEVALREKFGNDVERKNKSIKVHGNSYRVDADTVPCMRYRDYTGDYENNPNNYIGGILIQADNGEIIVNYPEQHIRNGKEKNKQTNKNYKRMVRIMKKMRYIMQDEKYESANNVSSFGLESLLWNLPNFLFTRYKNYGSIFGDILEYLKENIYELNEYKEANGIKPLCNSIKEVENYMNFINDLYAFFDYEIELSTIK